jgi:hypothetical protein
VSQQAPSPKCPKCGTVMVEGFDERPAGEVAGALSIVVAIPNGSYRCFRCGHEQPVSTEGRS